MTYQFIKDGQQLTVKVEGRLDTKTTPDFEKAVSTELDGITELTIDFSDLEYIASSGLRLLLTLQKRMNKQGSMVITGSGESIMDVFEVTGFVDILTLS
ncbi:MAG: STAS domain-containing protein [Atopobiaceae bacterium]|nr:STAS domain-containing protein [Atopobiaceae bacterium]